MKLTSLWENIRLLDVSTGKGLLRKSPHWKVGFSKSELEVKVSLDEGSRFLRFDVHCDWHELGSNEKGVPQLNFFLPFDYPCSQYLYDVTGGVVKRKPVEMDLPGLRFAAAPVAEGAKPLMLAAEGKHGFRGFEEALSLALIRSSYGPDPSPEQGEHEFVLYAGLAADAKPSTLKATAARLLESLHVVSAHRGSGKLPAEFSGVENLSANVSVTCIKQAESGCAWVIRGNEVDGAAGEVSFRFGRDVKAAWVSDAHERKGAPAAVSGSMVSLPVEKYKVFTLLVELQD
jgi:alpha-mannosidase